MFALTWLIVKHSAAVLQLINLSRAHTRRESLSSASKGIKNHSHRCLSVYVQINEFSVYVFTGELTDAPNPPKKHKTQWVWVHSVCAESIKRADAADETGLLNSTMAKIHRRRSLIRRFNKPGANFTRAAADRLLGVARKLRAAPRILRCAVCTRRRSGVFGPAATFGLMAHFPAARSRRSWSGDLFTGAARHARPPAVFQDFLVNSYLWRVSIQYLSTAAGVTLNNTHAHRHRQAFFACHCGARAAPPIPLWQGADMWVKLKSICLRANIGGEIGARCRRNCSGFTICERKKTLWMNLHWSIHLLNWNLKFNTVGSA